MKKARIVDGTVVEIWEDHPDGHAFEDCLPAETAALFVDVDDDTEFGDEVVVIAPVPDPAPKDQAPAEAPHPRYNA